MTGDFEGDTYTRRQYVLMRTLTICGDWEAAVKAADNAERRDPDVDYRTERRTFREWRDARAW